MISFSTVLELWFKNTPTPYSKESWKSWSVLLSQVKKTGQGSYHSLLRFLEQEFSSLRTVLLRQQVKGLKLLYIITRGVNRSWMDSTLLFNSTIKIDDITSLASAALPDWPPLQACLFLGTSTSFPFNNRACTHWPCRGSTSQYQVQRLEHETHHRTQRSSVWCFQAILKFE